MEHFKKFSFPSVRNLSSLPKHGHECGSSSMKRRSSEQQLESSNRVDCNTRFSLPRGFNKGEKEPVTVTESGWKENWLIFGGKENWLIFGVNQQSKKRMLQGRAGSSPLPTGCSSTLWAVSAAMYNKTGRFGSPWAGLNAQGVQTMRVPLL